MTLAPRPNGRGHPELSQLVFGFAKDPTAPQAPVRLVAGTPEEDEPARRAGPNGQELSPAEELRQERYAYAEAELKEVDPGNPLLTQQYLNAPSGFVPTEAEVEALENALAQARTGGPSPQGPVNTFANPGRPPQPQSTLEDAITEAIQESQFTGGKVVRITAGPNIIANPDPSLGPSQARYYVDFRDEFGKVKNYSVNYDPVNGKFGIIKPSSGK